MRTLIKIAIILIYILALAACRNQEPRDTESGQNDNFDRNHPMESEQVDADTTQNTTITDPTTN